MVITVHNQRYIKLRTFLRQLRVSSGLTQVQIAERLQMDQSNVSKVERGERYIDTLFFIDFCRACGVDPSKAMYEFEMATNQATDAELSTNERF
jgi:transcriptional regulator with XRE-family HTH domain